MRLFFLILAVFNTINCYIVEPVRLVESPYPPWAHSHWVWHANPDETQESLIQLVKDYKSYSIPVGGINIDSSWPEKYQNFKWNSKKFPDPTEMIKYFHSEDVKVMTWITSTVNNDSTNFQEAKQKGYFLNKGKLINWWRGHGALLDYSNPKAVEWWHQQMDFLLDIGIDGWKCDGTDPYVLELINAEGFKGHITEREYADSYYRDFYYHTKSKRGEALIWARPVDSYKNTLFLNYAPKDVMFSGWVGDQTGNWMGLKSALTNIIHSAWNNYLNFGMDIGGYRTDGSPKGRQKDVFIRWFQLGAFLPLMENGGNGEHRPWMFGQDVMEIYRKFAWIHTDLSLFLLSSGTECYYKNVSVIEPIARRRIPSGVPSTFDYILNNDLFVVPLTDNSTKIKSIKFPEKSNTSWTYWFNSSESFKGEVKNFQVPFDEFPVFIRDGSVIPLSVRSNYTQIGTEYSKDYVTLLLTKPSRGKHEKNIYEYKSSGYKVKYDYNSLLNELDIEISANENNKYIFLLNGVNSEKSSCFVQVEKGKFKAIESRNDSNQFWTDKVDSFYKPNKKQMFVKLVNRNVLGIHLRVKKVY